jgi:hypothetical protein
MSIHFSHVYLKGGYYPYRMINQACHISFICGINNYFLAYLEKLCLHEKKTTHKKLLLSNIIIYYT